MPEKGIRSTYSQCPFEIQTWDQQGLLSTASAFFYELDQSWFLVTNWHVISGRNSLTKRPLMQSGRFPTSIKAKISSYEIPGFPVQRNTFTTVAREVAIYENSDPLWFEHPTLGSLCDVVALPMERPQGCPEFMHNAANRISCSMRIPVEPGGTVFIIGFPRSISVGFGLPLWKAGYIASEPHYDVTVGGDPSGLGGLQNGLTLPAFFLDSQTREGMSGSPVFARFIGNWDMSNPYKPLDEREPGFWDRDDVAIWGSRGMQFVGCYSGRVMANEEEAALGLCWREDVIREICNGRKKAQHPQAQS